MSLTAAWMLFRPRAFARAREYGVFSRDGAVAPRVADEFIAQAERLLAAHGGGQGESWQYRPLRSVGLATLSRCSYGELNGVRSPVVWGLLLPREFLALRSLPLYACTKLFPPARLEPGGFETDLQLDGLQPDDTLDPSIAKLLAHYIETGALRVSLGGARALRAFCQIVESLPPRDRLAISFSTVEAGLFQVEESATAPSPEEIPFFHEGLARLELWVRLKSNPSWQHLPAVSIRDSADEWLGRDASPAELKPRYAALIATVREFPDVALRKAGFRYVRGALERYVERASLAAAGAVLDNLAHAGLLGEEYDVPPMWLSRVVLQKGCLHRLSTEMKRRVLRADVLPVLASALYPKPGEPALGRLDNLVRSLDGLGVRDALAPLVESCRTTRDEILERGITIDSFGSALTIALLGRTTQENGNERFASLF